MRFALLWGEGWPLLLLAPLCAAGLWRLDRARADRLRELAGPRARALAAELSGGRRRLRRWLATLGLLLGLVAALQPAWGAAGATAGPRGVDVVVCLDVSRSMLARDLQPNRLLAAKREIKALAARARGDRLGLVVYAGQARLLVPLTLDLRSFRELVDLAEPTSIARGGTDLGAALELALAALEGQSGEHEAVLLLTDGEDHEQRGLRAAERCRERGITVHCVGFGSAAGSKIAIETGAGEEFLRDRAGQEVVTALDPASLRRIAETTGGEFVDAGGRPQPLLWLYDQRIATLLHKSLAAGGQEPPTNRFQWPLLGAFVLWMLACTFTDRKRA
jgi:Ca-activated chloride channel family protein